MTAAANGPTWISGQDNKGDMRAEAQRRFADALRSYDSLESELIHRDVDVQTEGPFLLESLRLDVVVVLGGPVYPKKFIDAAALQIERDIHAGARHLQLRH